MSLECGRYRVGDDAGSTEDTADLALDVADLASAYLGGFDFHRLAHAGLVDERVEGAVEAATVLFRTDLPPYCPEVFSVAWDVRPTRDLEEFKSAVGAISHYFGGGPRRRARRAVRGESCRSSGCMRPSTATWSWAARRRSRSS